LALEMERISFWRESGVDLANITSGGEGPCGLTHSNKTRAKISASVKAKLNEPETKARMREAQKDKTFSEETRAKISAAKTGKKRAPFSDEWKAKLGTTLKKANSLRWQREREKKNV
jgi:hypothetical protein